MNITYKPAPKKVAKKVMRTIPKAVSVPTKFKAGIGTKPYFNAAKTQKISDNLRKLLERDKNNPEMKNVFEKNLDKYIENEEKFRNQLKMMEYVPEIEPKKVVAKKVMKTPAKKKMMKMVGNAKKDIMKKSMKKPIAFDKVEEALTGPKPRQVARFYRGGNVLPKGQKVAMPKKTTMKARKPMSAETKAKIKKGVSAYHKNCKKAMAMYSKMKK